MVTNNTFIFGFHFQNLEKNSQHKTGFLQLSNFELIPQRAMSYIAR